MEKRFDTLSWRSNRSRVDDHSPSFQDPRHDTPATGTLTSNVWSPLFAWRFGFQLKHIAIEFDPKHDYTGLPIPTTPQPMLTEDYYIRDNYSKYVTDSSETAALWLRDDIRIWLIDTRLKRRPGVPLKEDARHILHTNTRRYIEVDWRDEAWDGGSKQSVDIEWGWATLPDLHGYLEGFCENNKHDVWAHDLGVLAYEPFD
ncbi:hypothetical protein B0J13DRAFT_624694 [Dactylonectria estremocensis]|uniref:Uncharacterized protein n=1 Tax=Dactylonectria estremocensis TaxID=1079267 RepID=A0A9P9EMR3_9HYPO|nr:hypothetical protein B0J13DRAFT_624694 [Dactylonectria estremocensis]